MATIYIENEPYEVQDGQSLLQACLSLGFNLPYFCWHPALGSVGACRQCAVKLFKDKDDMQGRIVMACMTPASEGTRISIDDPEIRQFRASVTEWLMVNHPHDCPVCDEGGECHLQDMTVLTGHTYREFRFQKRTHRNQNLGPFINHEMNRCIACYRCVRFYREFAGGRDFAVFGAHNHVYFGRFEDGALESEFSGNLVEICPTGVFTDKTLKQHYARKWDLQTAPSICVHCGLGCNTIPGERYGTLRRIRNRYNHQVNGYFLCDRGRYGYHFVNSDQRIHRAVAPQDQPAASQPIAKEDAVQRVAGFLKNAERCIGIGSPRASLEANFALRTLVGPEHFYLGLSASDSRLLPLAKEVLEAGPARSPSLHDMAESDAVLVLGEDVSNTAPLVALALRQSVRQQPQRIARKLKIPGWEADAVHEAIQDDTGPLYIAALHGTRLDDIATRTYHAAPSDLARLGFAVARALDSRAPVVEDVPDDVAALAQEIADELRAAERPLVISGTGCASEALMQAAANVAWALCHSDHPAGLCLIVPECNSLGLAFLGGRRLEEAFRAVHDGAVDTMIVLENDLFRREETRAVHELLANAQHVVVLDHLANQTAMQSEIALPAATFAETSGTLVNGEGRAQRFFRVFVPGGDVQASWRWLRDIMIAVGRLEPGAWQALDEVLTAMIEAHPALEPILDAAPPADFRLAGQKVPRQSHRYTARTAMHADVDVNEPKPPDDPDSALAFSMEGYEGQPPAALIPRFWAPHWNSVQSLNKFQAEIAGPLQGGDPGVRLIEPGSGSAQAYFDGVPPRFEPRDGAWLAVPVYHVFGSDELSALTPGVLSLAPTPYLALNPGDAAGLAAQAGDEVEFHLQNHLYRLRLKLLPTLPSGVAGLALGLPGELERVLPGQWITVTGGSDHE